ncbi:hypothetical protein IFM89_025896 [Coptis chinensis]|uniref:Peptidase M1 membrane alanine aminopeptidase domain-containing protein n=1 Tax=Coptis chinensis TaxID=261450 RepID=A0A835I016_9MAGN|nr:hypothetical protein IFM89_025896 [Coptis chinensis]
MEWWTHLWLNEGFATWVSYLAADRLFPKWKIWTQFLDEITEGLRLDGLTESHPIERSLASYIKQYACSNANTEDLWAVGEKESGEPVNKLLNSWTKQKGYPVVSVSVKGNKLEFDQLFKINVDQTGFYGVKYDDELAGRLRYAIETNHLSATDRFGILDDSYALSMAYK